MNDNIYFCKTQIAGKKFEIESKNKQVLALFRGYLSEFDKPDYIIRASAEDIQREIKSNFNVKVSETEDEKQIATGCIGAESNVLYRKIADYMLEFSTILLHGAAIAVGNKCYIFTAPSGTGKTTHINNWLKSIPGTIVVNGDKPLINVETGLVYGTPWCGKEGMNTNISVPLAGIIHLERGENNTIIPISFREMLPVLLQQTYIPTAAKERIQTYQLLGKMNYVPCYSLKCNMDVESAAVAYQGICDYERNNDK